MFLAISPRSAAQQTNGTPTTVLFPAPALQLPGAVDSNSPAVWDLVGGQPMLFAFTSSAGLPSVSSGPTLARLGRAQPVTFAPAPGHGVWIEAVVADVDGAWYAYYHNEIPATQCGRPDRVKPRIGAARSRDRGLTWEDLGIVLEAPPGEDVCQTPNRYFVGGVGDVGVMLDRDSRFLYLFFSQYSRSRTVQGVAVARLLWADRDAPSGRVDIWVNGVWKPAERVVSDDEPQGESWTYPAGTPLVPVAHPWHDADPVNDAFWGASVHWNTYLQRYVMLLNRAHDESFTQEGIYVSFARALDNPSLWSVPKRILEGGQWYPQVMGLEPSAGTDALAGQWARFFMAGRSTYLVRFGYQ